MNEILYQKQENIFRQPGKMKLTQTRNFIFPTISLTDHSCKAKDQTNIHDFMT